MRTDKEIRLEAVPGKRKIIGFFLVVVLVGAGAFIAGRYISSPEEVAAAASDESVPVVVSVEKRVVGQATAVQGVVLAGDVKEVAVAPADGMLPVVTSVSAQAGEVVSSGEALGTVADRPLILLHLPIPLTRNLVFGDEGPDVTRFQAALVELGIQAGSNGRMDQRTLRAVRSLYERAGFRAPGSTVDSTALLLSEIVALPVPTATLLSAGAVGAQLEPEAPFARLQLSPNVVAVRADALQVESFVVGASVKIGASGHSIEGTVQSVGPFEGADEESGRIPGHDVRVQPTNVGESPLSINDPVVVTVSESGEDVLAVPLVSVRQGAGGPYVELAEEGAPAAEAGTEVRIEVLRQSGGWVAIEPNPDLAVGSKILVRP